MLTTVAGATLDGQWPLDLSSVNQVMNAVTSEYLKYFYQTLTAANWQVVYLLNYTDYIEYPITQIISLPTYDIFQVPVADQDGVPTEDVYIANELVPRPTLILPSRRR